MFFFSSTSFSNALTSDTSTPPLVIRLPSSLTNNEPFSLEAENNPSRESAAGFSRVGAVLFGEMQKGTPGRGVLVPSETELTQTVGGDGAGEIFAVSCNPTEAAVLGGIVP